MKAIRIRFALGVLFFIVFAYDIEFDRDFWTWMWLLNSFFSFANSYLRYQKLDK